MESLPAGICSLQTSAAEFTCSCAHAPVSEAAKPNKQHLMAKCAESCLCVGDNPAAAAASNVGTQDCTCHLHHEANTQHRVDALRTTAVGRHLQKLMQSTDAYPLLVASSPRAKRPNHSNHRMPATEQPILPLDAVPSLQLSQQ
jgi:hypothetical protein